MLLASVPLSLVSLFYSCVSVMMMENEHMLTGSGNGVAENIGVKDPVTAALAVSRGYHSALDIFSVFQGGNRYYCFLSLTHAAIANGWTFLLCTVPSLLCPGLLFSPHDAKKRACM